MKPSVYFKLQAKNLLKDYKTKTSKIDEVGGRAHFAYAPKYFDIGRIFREYDWDEEDFSLMKAQHLLALMLGFGKWADLTKASDEELEVAKLSWDNQTKARFALPGQESKANARPQITSLPLNQKDRAEFIEAANEVFEHVLERMEPRNPELTRKLWNAEDYVDDGLLTEDMLPISKDYALSLIDAFLVHHVLGLATQADKMAELK